MGTLNKVIRGLLLIKPHKANYPEMVSPAFQQQQHKDTVSLLGLAQSELWNVWVGTTRIWQSQHSGWLQAQGHRCHCSSCRGHRKPAVLLVHRTFLHQTPHWVFKSSYLHINIESHCQSTAAQVALMQKILQASASLMDWEEFLILKFSMTLSYIAVVFLIYYSCVISKKLL